MAAKSGLTYSEVITTIAKKDYKPVYLLMGDEGYYIDRISDYIDKHVLTDSEKEFDLTVVYGKDTNIDQIIMHAKSYPMLGSHQVIIVKEAQQISNYENLKFYMQRPQPSTILVFCYKYGTMDKRKKEVQEIAKKGLIFESKKLYDNQIPGWVIEFAKSHSIVVDFKAANMIADFLGNDLSRIANEMEKLFIVLQEQNQTIITAELIEKNIGISKDYNNFELVNAVAQKNVLKANRIINYFAKSTKNNPIVVTNVVLYNFFVNLFHYFWLKDKSQYNVASELKINPYFVKEYETAARHFSSEKTFEIIGLIRNADATSKGFKNNGNISDYEILSELVFKILH